MLEVVQELDLDNFEAAYRRIAVAKGLAKSPAPEVGDTPVSNVTLGAIVAQSARQPLESFAAALERLNAETPHDHWTDMVVVLGTGVISYGVQFPGEGIAGDHLPPARGAGQGNAPPWYVVIAIRPIADFAFNKLVAFLTAQLKFFSPGAQLPKYQDFLVGMPDTCITHGGFQFNLAGHLVPVLREHYNDRYLPPQPLRIEDRKGDLLATIQRLPWQDGAVLLLHGKKVPLEGLLVFFDPPARPTLTTFRRENEVQLSCVLPMSPAQFTNGLRRFQRQSNMLIKPPAGQIVVQKVSDEGTTSPFIARLMLGILRLRDTIYLDAKARDGFDTLFEQVSSSLSSARDAAREIGELWAAHEGKVASGTCVRRTANVIHIDDNIDRDLRRVTETFLNASVRALKHGLQQTAKELGVDLGFWFKKKPAFERGLEALRAPDADLAEYLASARSAWSETLVSRRNAIEHEAWVLPRLSYRDIAGAVVVDEPVVDGMTLRAFTTVMLDRFFCAVEDILRASHSTAISSRRRIA